jgi:hypothetical protein
MEAMKQMPDKDYFDAQEKRFAAHTAQQSLFTEATP